MKYLINNNEYNYRDFVMDRVYNTLSHKYNFYKKGKRQFLYDVKSQMMETVVDINSIIKKYDSIKE